MEYYEVLASGVFLVAGLVFQVCVLELRRYCMLFADSLILLNIGGMRLFIVVGLILNLLFVIPSIILRLCLLILSSFRLII